MVKSLAKLKNKTPRPVIDLDAMSPDEKLAHYSAKIRRSLAGDLGSMFAAKDVTESIIAVIDLKIETAINNLKSELDMSTRDLLDDKLKDFDDRIHKKGQYDPDY